MALPSATHIVPSCAVNPAIDSEQCARSRSGGGRSTTPERMRLQVRAGIVKARIRKGTDTIIDAIETTQSHPDELERSDEAAKRTRRRKGHGREMRHAILRNARERDIDHM